MTEIVEGIATIDDVDAFLDLLGAIGDEYGVAVQVFDARGVVDRAHLERAVDLANRAVERGNTVARDRSVEILLWAAGRRQIDQALALGASEGEGPVAVIVDDGGEANAGAEDAAAAAVSDLFGSVEPTLGEYHAERVDEFYGITDAERRAVDGDRSDLVRERVALLAVER